MKTPAKKRKTARRSVRKTRQKRLVEKAIESIGSKLETNEVKGTMGDLIRLLQFQKEMDGEEPREIEVKWVAEESNE